MIDICSLLLEICEDDKVLNPDCELIDSGLLDSLALIMLVSKLEDSGIVIIPTRINKEILRTPRSIQEYVDKYLKEHIN